MGRRDLKRRIEIQSDGRTVWVHRDGMTVGRFGRMGIDVHTADATACLDCTHGETGRADWEQFKGSMLRHHGISVADKHAPVLNWEGDE